MRPEARGLLNVLFDLKSVSITCGQGLGAGGTAEHNLKLQGTNATIFLST
jgi:hypothetical protein